MASIIEAVRSAGVVGAGGAGFPTHVKLAAKAEMVIANAAECEPLLRVDQQLIIKERENFLQGLLLAMEATGAKQGVIAIKAKYHDAVKVLHDSLPPQVRLHFLPDIYPAGDEVVAIHEVTGKVVPPGGLPLQVGVIVNNVQTLINVGKAAHGQPVTRRTLTITGWVHTPLTVSLPIGTSFADALELAGGAMGKKAAYLVGGPMMGYLLNDLNESITKTTGGLIVLPEGHTLIEQKRAPWASILQRAKSACLQCSYCTELCPRHMLGHRLMPHLIMRATNYGVMAKAEDLTASLICSECGVCEYACPAGLSPRRVNIAYKQRLRAEGIKYTGDVLLEDTFSFARQVPTARIVQRLALQEFSHLAPLTNAEFVPAQVNLPLRQHTGAPAVPIVKNGQTVKEGEVIAEIPEGQLGARIHASISGKIQGVTSDRIVIVRKRGR